MSLLASACVSPCSPPEQRPDLNYQRTRRGHRFTQIHCTGGVFSVSVCVYVCVFLSSPFLCIASQLRVDLRITPHKRNKSGKMEQQLTMANNIASKVSILHVNHFACCVFPGTHPSSKEMQREGDAAETCRCTRKGTSLCRLSCPAAFDLLVMKAQMSTSLDSITSSGKRHSSQMFQHHS